MRFKSSLLPATIVAFSLFSVEAKALIVNGSFETGDFSGWTTGANSFSQSIVTSPVEDGTYAAQIAGFDFLPNTLSQIVATTPGQSYVLSFWRYQDGGPPPVGLIVSWDSAAIFTEATPGPITFGGYQNFTANVVGNGSDTLLFTSYNNRSFTFLDNVTLTAAVPELSTWAMMVIGFVVLGFASHRRLRQQTAVASAKMNARST